MIKELLEAEIKKSADYSKTSFGAMVGEDFPALYKEVVESEDVAAILTMDFALMGLFGKEVASDMAKDIKETSTPSLSAQIKKHQAVFAPFINMLYWGINIGRQLEAQKKEVDILNKMAGL